MSRNTAPEIPTLAVGETILHSVSFEGVLDSGESLSGTPAITEVTTSDLTITNKVVSTEELIINGRAVAAGKAVQCLISGQQIDITYTVKIVVATDSSPAQTKVKFFKFKVEGA